MVCIPAVGVELSAPVMTRQNNLGILVRQSSLVFAFTVVRHAMQQLVRTGRMIAVYTSNVLYALLIPIFFQISSCI